MQPELPLSEMQAPRKRSELALERAQRFLVEAGVRKPPVDIERLARLMGVVAIEVAWIGNAAACLLPGRKGHKILIKEGSSLYRRRFSIAHEVGHLILGATRIRFRDVRTARAEKLCDELAAELLMPREMYLREMYGRAPSLDTVCHLANTFRVSLEPAAIRFGVLSRDQIQVVCWERRHASIGIKWATGENLVSRKAHERLSDRTFGPSVAFGSQTSDVITSYAHLRNSASLNLVCQSRAFGDYPYRFVLSVVRRE